MTRLHWRTSRTVSCGPIALPCADSLTVQCSAAAGMNQIGGIRPNTPRQLRLKRLAWPLVRLHNDLLSTGFLERQLARWIRAHAQPDTTFLEVGAGEMGLLRFMPANVTYNGLDIAFSEFALRRVMRHERRAGGVGGPNLVLANVADIPLPDNAVSMVACKEVLMYVPDVAAALSELRRVCKPGAHVMCTIGNLRCRKYDCKGLQPDFRSAFTFDEFRTLAESRGFRCIEAKQKGWWIPLPTWLTRTTNQLPFTSRNEYDNTNFMYLLQAMK